MNAYGEFAAHARQELLSYEEFLLAVMERERETRRQHRVECEGLPLPLSAELDDH
jgi:hypothetical protein